MATETPEKPEVNVELEDVIANILCNITSVANEFKTFEQNNPSYEYTGRELFDQFRQAEDLKEKDDTDCGLDIYKLLYESIKQELSGWKWQPSLSETLQQIGKSVIRTSIIKSCMSKVVKLSSDFLLTKISALGSENISKEEQKRNAKRQLQLSLPTHSTKRARQSLKNTYTGYTFVPETRPEHASAASDSASDEDSDCVSILPSGTDSHLHGSKTLGKG